MVDLAISMRLIRDHDRKPEPSRFSASVSAFRTAAAMALAADAAARRTEAADAQTLIERARAWTRETGVGHSACQLYQRAKPWSAWAKRDDWAQWNTLEVSDAKSGRNTANADCVAFTRAGHRWEFTHKESQSYLPDDDCRRGVLTVAYDGEAVMGLLISKTYDEFAEWMPADIDLLSVGPWAAELVEMEVVLDQQRQQQSNASAAERVLAKASRIKL